jgi:hypothetical protein
MRTLYSVQNERVCGGAAEVGAAGVEGEEGVVGEFGVAGVGSGLDTVERAFRVAEGGK